MNLMANKFHCKEIDNFVHCYGETIFSCNLARRKSPRIQACECR